MSISACAPINQLSRDDPPSPPKPPPNSPKESVLGRSQSSTVQVDCVTEDAATQFEGEGSSSDGLSFSPHAKPTEHLAAMDASLKAIRLQLSAGSPSPVAFPSLSGKSDELVRVIDQLLKVIRLKLNGKGTLSLTLSEPPPLRTAGPGRCFESEGPPRSSPPLSPLPSHTISHDQTIGAQHLERGDSPPPPPPPSPKARPEEDLEPYTPPPSPPKPPSPPLTPSPHDDRF